MKRILSTLIAMTVLGSLLAQNTKTITFTARYTDDSYVSFMFHCLL